MPALAALAIAAGPGGLGPGDHTRTLTVDGRTRTYLVHVPKVAGRPCPVVLIYHGGASNAAQMVRFCGLNAKADAVGFVAVYPNGTGRQERALTWNGGNCRGYAMLNRVDDVAFTRALLDDLATVLPVDARRVYATGMSNGAVMAYRLASELADRMAAIAPVSGPMGTARCSPKRPVSVIHFHGTADEFAPFQGGRGRRSLTGTDHYSVEHSVRAWVKADGCKDEPVTEVLPVRVNDGTRVTKRTYAGGKDGSEVVLVEIEGGGHTWPGREPTVWVLGKATRNVSANDLMWEFFERHPRR